MKTRKYTLALLICATALIATSEVVLYGTDGDLSPGLESSLPS